MVELNKDTYIALDLVYSELSDNIDWITSILSKEEIEPIYIDSIECITISEYNRIKTIIKYKRNSKAIIIGCKDEKLIDFTPTI